MDKEKYKLSMIVPVYNMEQYIERCMASLLRLDYEGVEILCIDDGSTDGSGKICEGFALRDRRVKVIHQDNQGLPAARNTGLSSAKGEYITFVDSDDWADSRLFDSFVKFMDSHPDVDLCIGGMVREYPDDSAVPMFEESPPRLFHREDALREMVTNRFFFWYMCGKVYRRTVFERFSADERVTTCEDLDSLWQIFSSGKVRDVWYSPEYKYHYFYNTNGMTEGKKRLERYKSDLYVFEKILRNSTKEKAEILDLIRGRAIRSVYSILREYFFEDPQSEDISDYIAEGILILNKMDADRKRKDTIARRLKRMADEEGYAKEYFENVFSSMKRAVAEAGNFPKKYIYGTGVVSQYITTMMKESGDFDGFVISDGRPSTLSFAGKPVYHKSELPQEGEKAMILAVNRKNQSEIMEELNRDRNTKILIPNIPIDF